MNKLRIALFGNIYQTKKPAALQHVLDALAQSGAELSVDMEFFYFLKDTQHLNVKASQVFAGSEFEADFAVSVGGDGTFLKTAARIGSREIPILGINMGRLGFLADISPDDIGQCVDALRQGDYAVESRAIIQAELSGKTLYALNDVAILKRDTASMISIRADIDGVYLTTYQADGLIISTPTGSTAYSLSNGGPIIVPGTRVLALTAVAPHSLNIRPIVIPDTATITLDVESRSHSFLVAADGNSEKCREGTRLHLRRAPYDANVLKRSGINYFSTLREKMMWGADVR